MKKSIREKYVLTVGRIALFRAGPEIASPSFPPSFLPYPACIFNRASKYAFLTLPRPQIFPRATFFFGACLLCINLHPSSCFLRSLREQGSSTCVPSLAVVAGKEGKGNYQRLSPPSTEKKKSSPSRFSRKKLLKVFSSLIILTFVASICFFKSDSSLCGEKEKTLWAMLGSILVGRRAFLIS